MDIPNPPEFEDAEQQPAEDQRPPEHVTPPTVFDAMDLSRPVVPGDGSSPCLGEVLYYMFEWITRNKATERASNTAWSMLAEVLPPDNFPQSYKFVKNIMERYLKGKVRTIHLCPNGHIAYWDGESGPLRRYRYARNVECLGT